MRLYGEVEREVALSGRVMPHWHGFVWRGKQGARRQGNGVAGGAIRPAMGWEPRCQTPAALGKPVLHRRQITICPAASPATP